MGIASDMKRLTRDIASSHEERLKRVSEIRGETKEAREEAQDLIKRFQASRKELRAELKEASAAWQELRSPKTKNKKQRKEA